MKLPYFSISAIIGHFKKSFVKYLIDIILVILFIFILSQSISLAVKTGFLWSATKNIFSKDKIYFAQKYLFSIQSQYPVDIVVIGDQRFIDDIQPILPQEKKIFYFNFKEMNLKDTLLTLRYLQPDKIETIVIQNMPDYWTRVRSGLQKFDVWDSHIKHRNRWWPIGDVRLFFETIRNASKSISAPNEKLRRMTTAFGAEFKFPPLYVKYILANVKNIYSGNKWEKILWVYNEDYGFLNDTSNEIKEKFYDLVLERRYEKGLGKFVMNSELGISLGRLFP